MVNVAAIFSTLGNPNSLVPLAIKDTASSTGMTVSSFVTGKEEGQDRFIDEVGTEFLWLLGIPVFKKIFDSTVYKAYNIDSKFDVRNLDNKEIFEKIQKYAPSEDIKNNLTKIAKNKTKTKNIALAKFIVPTALTIASYIGLTKAKHHYTEQKIRKNILAEYNKNKQKENNTERNSNNKTSFKGAGNVIRDFAYSPVKNMWILDGAITTERLADSRSPQEFAGYAIKEASLLFFMYYMGGKIQDACEKIVKKKYNKSIALDARILESSNLQKSFEDGSIQNSIIEFEKAKAGGDAEIYEFLHKNPDNHIVKAAKKSEVIKMYHKPKKWYQIFEKSHLTDKIDTRKYIDIKEIKAIAHNFDELYKQYQNALSKGESSQKFFAGVKKLKRGSIIMNIGSSILALGVFTPLIMLAKRLSDKNDVEFFTKKQIREQLKSEGLIV